MAVLKRFFFWFSVRMGAIITSIFSLIQAAIWLMIALISIKNQDDVRAFLGEIITSLDVRNKQFLFFSENPHALLIILTVFFALYLFSCILLIWGSLMCNDKLLCPFLVLDMIYIIVMAILMALLLINFKERGYGIGALIMYSNFTAITVAPYTNDAGGTCTRRAESVAGPIMVVHINADTSPWADHRMLTSS